MTALVDKICTMPGSVNITLCMLQGVWAQSLWNNQLKGIRCVALYEKKEGTVCGDGVDRCCDRVHTMVVWLMMLQWSDSRMVKTTVKSASDLVLTASW